jgi:DNA-directed RNA polymerase subunit RPC12/RpoP
MKKSFLILLIAVAALLATISVVQAQGETLKLDLSRDWGYGGFGEIQGTFTLSVTGPSNLARVEFYIDDTKIGEVSQAPFKLQFVTDNYPAGAHSLSAVGILPAGARLASNKIDVAFISASNSNQKMITIVGPILGLTFGAILLSALVSIITGRKNKNLPAGARRSYPFGGGICKKCGRPFAFSVLSMNMIGGKLVRCPYCGKWGLVKFSSTDKLRAAEEAELEREKGHIPEPSDEEKLKKELDDSRFQEM